jgi:hypothetical protein
VRVFIRQRLEERRIIAALLAMEQPTAPAPASTASGCFTTQR